MVSDDRPTNQKASRHRLNEWQQHQQHRDHRLALLIFVERTLLVVRRGRAQNTCRGRSVRVVFLPFLGLFLPFCVVRSLRLGNL